MITTQIIKYRNKCGIGCRLPKKMADDLNWESGRIYSAVMVEHWRIYRNKCGIAFRKKGVWLKQSQAEKLGDLYDADSPRHLHAHSIDAAQQGFYKLTIMKSSPFSTNESRQG